MRKVPSNRRTCSHEQLALGGMYSGQVERLGKDCVCIAILQASSTGVRDEAMLRKVRDSRVDIHSRMSCMTIFHEWSLESEYDSALVSRVRLLGVGKSLLRISLRLNE